MRNGTKKFGALRVVMDGVRQLLVAPLAEWFLTRIIRSGRVPKHVAVVADGARRFGRKYDIPVQENHEVGLFKCMWAIIDWCLLFGISEYSILMYSFGNYYRPKDEVGHWIEVLRVYLKKLIMNWRSLQRKGIRLNFYGKVSLIPEDINGLMGMLVLITKDNTKLTVNMAMGYTSKHELSSVSFGLISARHRGELEEASIAAEFFNECLFAVDNRNVDLLIRTSGFHRISNFLCWQVHDGVFYFNDVLWPEFNIFHFMRAILCYQASTASTLREQGKKFDQKEQQFIDDWKLRRRSLLLDYCGRMKYFPAEINLKRIWLHDYETLYSRFEDVHPHLTQWFE